MRSLITSLLLGGFCLMVASVALAQDVPPVPVVPFPAPAPAPYPLDLPDLHPPNPDQSPSLFPNGPRQGQPPADMTEDQLLEETRNSRNHRRGGAGAPGAQTHGRARDSVLARADSDPIDVRVSYRRAKTQAMAQNPGLADLLHKADGAATDVQKRGYLKDYYKTLYKAIGKIDPSPAMKQHLFVLNFVAEQRYDPKRRTVGGDEDLVNNRRRRAR